MTTLSIRQLEWRAILVATLLIIGRFTLAWAGNVSPMIQDTGTRVGIGTTGPTYTLDIMGRGLFRSNNWPLGVSNSAGTSLAWMGTSNNALIFYNAAGTEMVRIAMSGNFGIGTASPVTKLHVAGDAQVDGNLAAKYQDVAEWVQASGPLPAGTVVVIDPQTRNQVLPASQAFDSRVAGVVSNRPGILLGEAAEGKVKVAQSGRVMVKADASYGPITPGDLLTTSPTPGHAMRSRPISLGETTIHRPGTVLGKALESLREGRGEILVLLTLQ